jgi:hypothetical protein
MLKQGGRVVRGNFSNNQLPLLNIKVFIGIIASITYFYFVHEHENINNILDISYQNEVILIN